MRISDWSSDVCSSDLHFDPHVAGIEYGALDSLVGYAIRRAQILIYEDFLAALQPWDITPQRFSALTLIAANARLKLTELAQIQIGRASCRERVCQYV